MHESPVADLQAQLRMNLEPAWLVTGAALPAMLAAGEGAFVASPRAPRCSRSPAAPRTPSRRRRCSAFVDALHVEYAQDGIRANAILPVVIDTPANRASQPDADSPRG